MILSEKNPHSVEKIIALLKQGEVIAFPVDTIYGVAVDATNCAAVEKLYQLKKRDEKKPIAIFLPNIKAAQEIFTFDKTTKNIVEKYLPGALTVVAKVNENAKKILAKNLNKNDDNFLGFRIVDSFFVQNLFKKFDGILAVSSANISALQPAQSADEIAQYFPELALIISGEIKYKRASTVIKITDNKIELIRPGALEIDELKS